MNDILKEYVKLLNRKGILEKNIKDLPKGYLSKKTISGRSYYYLQERKGKTIQSHYLRDMDIESTQKQIQKRKECTEELSTISHRLFELENAAKSYDMMLYRQLKRRRLSFEMDYLTKEEKEECLSFSSILTSVEGVPPSEELLEDLEKWKEGEISFLNVFENTVSRYSV